MIVLLGAVAPGGRGSDFLSTTWRTEEGLPHSAINSIVQTRDGYLWLGTYVGLVRFDGVRFVHYSTANMPQLGQGRVAKLFEDRDGVLWIALESGRLLAFKNGEARIHLPNSPSPDDAATAVTIPGDVIRRDDRRDRPTPNDPIVSMAQDRAGTIWVQTANGHFGRLTSDGVEFMATTGPLSHRAGLGLVIDGAGRLWVGTKDGLRLWENGGLMAPPGMERVGAESVDAFARARDGD
jgi:ligand-binding sensor domain-containing protein